MKYIISLVLFLFSALYCQAQFMTGYDYYDSSSKQVVYYEDFTDSVNNEWLSAGDTSLAISQGEYGIYNWTDIYRSKVMPVDINDSVDFEIEVRVKQPCDCYDEGVIVWNYDEQTEKCNKWVFDNTRYDHIFIYPAEPSQKAKKYIVSCKKNKTEHNVYTIRKIMDNYYMFVNGKYIEKMPYAALKSNLIGIGAGKKSAVKCDYIKVSRLTKSFKYPILKGGYYSDVRTPEKSKIKCETGHFLMKFRVNSSGNIDSIISYGVYPDLVNEAARAIMESNSNWIPAHQNNKPFDKWVLYPALFNSVYNACYMSNYTARSAEYIISAKKLSEEGDLEKAIEHYKLAIGLDYKNVQVFYDIADAYIKIGKKAEAYEYIQLLSDIKESDLDKLKSAKQNVESMDISGLMNRYRQI